jgi:hypothetical protein
VRITFLRPVLMTAAIVASAGILAGGLALRPAFAVGGTAIVGPFTITNCSKSTACKTYNNAGKGYGLQGTNTNSSASGAGLLGTATQLGTGVMGIAVSGAGVAGGSVTGSGLAGSSSSGVGVAGQTNSTTASAAGVQGTNNSFTIGVRANGFGGPLFDGNSSTGLDVFTVDDAGNTAIGGTTTITGAAGYDALDAGTGATSTGVSGQGAIGVAGFGVGSGSFGVYAANAATSGGTALVVQDTTNAGVLMNGYDSGGNPEIQIQDNGYVYAHAFVQESDTPTGLKVATYATMASTPNLEDFGEAQLTNGQAYVSLKRAYSSAIDARFAYMVFITPEGDTRGLYVTRRTPAGFEVRENQGGRSDATFSYRIVAKPYGSTTATLRPSIAPQRRLMHPPAIAKLRYVPKTKPKA